MAPAVPQTVSLYLAALAALALRELGEDEAPEAVLTVAVTAEGGLVNSFNCSSLAGVVHAQMTGRQLLATVSELWSLVAPHADQAGAWRSLHLSWEHGTTPSSGLAITITRRHEPGDQCALSGGMAVKWPSWVLAHFHALISAFTEDSSRQIAAVPLVTDGEERSWLLGPLALPREEAHLHRDETLVEIFAATAAAYPEHMALEFAGQAVTYRELAMRTDGLSAQLRARGAGAGKVVGLYMERGAAAVEGLLAILKSGAAYVPMDPDYPADRVHYILANCGAVLVLTQQSLKAKVAPCPVPLLCLDENMTSIKSASRIKEVPRPVTRNDVAYLIYTSGSTGRPKGVEVEHRSVCHFVRAEAEVFQLTPEDRVYQGFSLAFDASVEELWLAFAAGACLVVASREAAFATQDLSAFLNAHQITVFSTVPTVLAAMEGALGSVRLLILGGEAASPQLISRWGIVGRRIVNTYGPTEATVVATYQDCVAGAPVTIGKALPNLETYILDDEQQLLPVGAIGELYLGGPCLARGYLGQAELSAEKFVVKPAAFPATGDPRLYRTGDLARFVDDGAIDFVGRKDAQIKIRGYRVELAEIEAVLARCPGVAAAAVAVRPSPIGIDQLVGYVVCQGEHAFAKAAALQVLKECLAPFMVPSVFIQLPALPMLPSGKLARKLLPTPEVQAAAPVHLAFANASEEQLHQVWAPLFAPGAVGVDDDFFELGGHSLLAAKMISQLRAQRRFAELSVLDVYTYPTIKGLASRADERNVAEDLEREASQHRARIAVSPALLRAVKRCGCAQLVGLYIVFALAALPFYGAIEVFLGLKSQGLGLGVELAVIGAISALLWPLWMLVAVAAKWLIIGRFRPGVYPLWGTYYWRFWLVQRITGLLPLAPLRGTLLINWYFRAMGAKIGRNVHLASHYMQIFDELTIADGASIGLDAQLLGYQVKDYHLIIGSIDVGPGSYVGTKSLVAPHASLGADASLAAMSMLGEGLHIPGGATWAGSPAKPIVGSRRPVPEQSPPGLGRALFYALAHAAALALVPFLLVAANAPTAWAMAHWAATDSLVLGILLMPLAAAASGLTICLGIVVLKWVIVGKVKPRHYQVMSLHYLRKWFIDVVLGIHLQVLHSQYATLYLVPWLRLLGAKIGQRVEVSTASHIAPDLLHIGDECFVADSACLGAPSFHHGIAETAATRIGARTFVGNSALVPIGAQIAGGCLIGCLSVPPFAPASRAIPGSAWLGSPAMLLPRREVTETFPEAQTFAPPPRLYAIRLAIEFFRVTLPTTFFYYAGVVFVETALYLMESLEWPAVLVLMPLAAMAIAAAAVAVVVAIKWLVVGRLKPAQHPLWSSFIWRNELVTALHESFAAPLLINSLQGTPFLPLYFRAMGCHIGRGVYMETTQITEFDLVHIGDCAGLNSNCTVQTHLFEDRIFKMSTLHIGAGCSVGAMAVVLYDSSMGEDSSIDGLSLVMKGEALPAHTAWAGIPAQKQSLLKALTPAEAAALTGGRRRRVG